ncbi:hypothetical protein PBR20603_03792 [Pandoraea bronchicola]|uniref:Uncharacterized protein n=1 Tax=Pandoraea bronchicola TaxID=2508287 RepID=A0A5E5BVI3_9BURK|nr:hypothetical protein PBR20603_03792 [Pandoraea bronchicola]
MDNRGKRRGETILLVAQQIDAQQRLIGLQQLAQMD